MCLVPLSIGTIVSNCHFSRIHFPLSIETIYLLTKRIHVSIDLLTRGIHVSIELLAKHIHMWTREIHIGQFDVVSVAMIGR